jgi:RNA polymerase sigma factor (sigma-70 family)
MNFTAKKYKPLAPGEASRLIEKARAGDRAAINRLVDGSVLLAVLLTNRHRRCSIDREELFSLSLLAVLDCIRHYDPLRGAWSTCLAQWIKSRWNVALAATMAQKRGYGAAGVSLDDIADTLPGSTDTGRGALLRELADSLRRLPSADADLVKLRLAGFTCGELAQARECSPATVYQRENKTIRKLKRNFA